VQVINGIIRDEIGFDGCLMSDDISMKALGGDVSSRSNKNLGCRMRCRAPLQWRYVRNAGSCGCRAGPCGAVAGALQHGFGWIQTVGDPALMQTRPGQSFNP
jgi:hypothetical protein